MLKSFASGEFKGMFKDGFVSYESLNSEERIHFAAEFEFFFVPYPFPTILWQPSPPRYKHSFSCLSGIWAKYLSISSLKAAYKTFIFCIDILLFYLFLRPCANKLTVWSPPFKKPLKQARNSCHTAQMTIRTWYATKQTSFHSVTRHCVTRQMKRG